MPPILSKPVASPSKLKKFGINLWTISNGRSLNVVFNDTSALGLFDFLNGKIPESSNPNDVSAVKEKSSIISLFELSKKDKFIWSYCFPK